MLAREVLDPAARLLLDSAGDYWSDDELLGYLSEGQQQIAELKPDTVATTITWTLVNGVRQTLPDDAIVLIDVNRNRGLTQFDEGPAITAVDRRDLDRAAPGWQEQTSRTVEHYMYDGRDKRTFYVYPAQPQATGSVELIYAARPPVINNRNDTLALAETYAAPLIDYVLYRAHSKDSTAAVAARAQAHYQQFLSHLGLYGQAERRAQAGERDAKGLR